MPLGFERQSLVIATNLPIEKCTEVSGSERLTGTSLDRLTHRCHILYKTCKKYRLKDASNRSRRQPQE